MLKPEVDRKLERLIAYARRTRKPDSKPRYDERRPRRQPAY